MPGSIDHRGTPIAVIGFSLKFPGDACSADQFWKMLMEKRSAMTNFPSDRINLAGHYHPRPSRLDQLPVRGGNFVEEELDRFDAPFFSINAEEAACMDPQQRGILETAYRALENSGITIEQCSGTKTSVHTGSFTDDYRSVLFQDPLEGHRYAASGIASSMLANRISWFFNLKGPSINLHTACSSSLTCLHLACEDLRTGATEMGLVGGCNLIFHPDYMKIMSNMGFLSVDGRSWSLDEKANGYARGEGFGMLVVKRLSDAIRDGDTIRAVIRATSLNQDGRTPGITVPSGTAHKELICETYSKANLDMEPTRFFEAHATGTQAGDPIEANAVGEAFSHVRSDSDPLWMGAVKSNVGHLEAASGMAGILKSILILEKGVIPPNAGFEQLNSRIRAKQYHLAIPTVALKWPTSGLRRICVNSFGFGGSNALVVLDDSGHYLSARGLTAHHRTQIDLPEDQSNEVATSLEPDRNGTTDLHAGLLVWSSADEGGVRRMQSKLASFFEQHVQELHVNDMKDIEYTLAARRTNFRWRSFVAFSNISDLRGKLATPLPKAKASQERKIAFIFSGQGAQYTEMGMCLLDFPVFRNSLARSQVLLDSLGCGWKLLDILHAAPGTSQIDKSEFSQPLCTVLQLALVDLLTEFGVKPEAVVGHSSGEIAAAYCAGVLSHRSALQIAFHRGRLAAALSTPTGPNMAMLATGVGHDEAKRYLKKLEHEYHTTYVDLACINSPGSVTFSGDGTQISYLEKLIQNDGKFVRRLHVNIAYHSQFMVPIAESYRNCLDGLRGPSTKLESSPVIVSSVTGDFIDSAQLCTAEYWVKNMTNPVQFFDAISKLTNSLPGKRYKILGKNNRNSLTISDFVEIGPHTTLRGPIMESLRAVSRHETVQYHATLSRTSQTTDNLLDTAGKLFSRGYPVDILLVNNLPASSRRIRTDLPEYDFQHSQSYWRESRIGKNYRLRDTPHNDFLGVRSSDWNPLQAQWRNLLLESQLPWLRDHRIAGDFLYPAGGMISMAVEAARQLADPAKDVVGYELRKLHILRALRVLHRETPTETRFSLSPLPESPKWSQFQLFAYEENSWIEICRGQIQICYNMDYHEKDYLQRWETQGFLAKFSGAKQVLASKEHYNRLSTCYDAEYGPAFQTISNISLSGKWASAYDDNYVSPHMIHPATIDGIFQLVFPASGLEGNTKKLLVPSLAALSQNMLRVMGECSIKGYRKRDPLIDVEHYETTLLSRDNIATHPDSARRMLCATMRWLPDLDLLSPTQIRSITYIPQTVPTETTQYFLFVTLERLNDSDSTKNLESHRQHEETYGSCEREQRMLHDEDFRISTINYLRSYNSQGEVLITLSEKLYQIIHDEVDLLQFLFNGNLASEYYREIMTENPQMATLTRYLNLMGHKQPGMRILEIGAGVGSVTQAITSALLEGQPRWSHYLYTDVSPGFFPGAQNRFSEFSSSMKFQVFDAAIAPLEQGLEHSSFDLIIAGNVLHVLKDSKTSLRNIRSLLKPAGRLLLFETTSPSPLRTGLYGGMFKDWWNGIKDPDTLTPLLGIDSWSRALKEAGFTNMDLSILIASTQYSPSPNSLQNGAITILINQDSQEQKALGRELSKRLDTNGTATELLCIDSITSADMRGTTCVSLLEIGNSYLSRIQEVAFGKIQQLIGHYQNILWLTQDDQVPVSPEFAVVDGLARVIRVEYPFKKFVTLALEPQNIQPIEGCSGMVCRVLYRMLSTDIHETEFEYREHNGMLHINRVIHSQTMNDMISARSIMYHPVHAPLKTSPPLELRVGISGVLNTFQYHEVEVPPETRGEDSILVRACAFGLTPRDHQIASGQINDAGYGVQCSGTVEKTGPATGFSVGDRVCVVKHSAFQTLLRCHAENVVKIPEWMSITDASSIPAAAMLAVHCLINMARPQSTETVFVHEAATTVGQIFVQIAQHLHTRVFAAVCDEEQREELSRAYGIPKKNIILENVFSKNVLMEVAGDKGFDIIINSSTDQELVETSWRSLSCLGRLIHIGEHEIAVPQSRPDYSSISFCSIEIGDLLRGQPTYARQLLGKVSLLMQQKVLSPPFGLQLYSPGETMDALRRYRGGKSTGSSVIDLYSDNTLTMTIKTRPVYQFDRDSTYVIAGGLGELGQSIARWMVDRGARHLLLLSRSGLSNPHAGPLLEELAGRGAQISAPSCDIADLNQLQGALNRALKTMPPIRGLIQSAMVLRDAPFENITWENWADSTRPKVQGSWNLHQTMPKGMDFFLLLSSASEIDSLCHFRNATGERTSVINPGVLTQDSAIAETGELSSLRSLGQLMEVSLDELFALLEHHCNPENHSQDPENNQTIFGITLPRTFAKRRQEVPSYLTRPLFRHFHYVEPGSLHGVLAESDHVDYASILSNADSTDQAAVEMIKWFEKKLSGIVGISGVDIDTLKPLSSYGIDSLVGMEIRNWFEQEMGAKISIFELLGTSNIADICQRAAASTRFRAKTLG
ncbi:putative polyketide synthase [Hypoxylon sp. FL1150]|nr:putative polyketide synthase [Hypoxylon sp. FL1150]